MSIEQEIHMRVLLLGKENTKVANFLLENENLIITEIKINLEYLEKVNPDFIISYNYRYLIEEEIIDNFPDQIINLHISYLPWNRGADPNLWSFIDDTPKGVTIHKITAGLDKGDILLQRKITFQDIETLYTSYMKLQDEIQTLFIDNWNRLKNNLIFAESQVGKGSYHRRKDKEKILSLLPNGWNTKIWELKEIIQTNREILL